MIRDASYSEKYVEQTLHQTVISSPPLIPVRPRPLTADELRAWIDGGHRCVRFPTCVSFLVGSLYRQSPVYLTSNWQARYLRGLGFSLLALLCGPWAIPWGPVWAASAVWINLTGGIDVTDEVRREIDSSPATDRSLLA